MKIIRGFENVNDPNGISIEKFSNEYLRVYDKFEVSFEIPGKRIIKVNGFSSVRSLGLGSFHSCGFTCLFFRRRRWKNVVRRHSRQPNSTGDQREISKKKKMQAKVSFNRKRQIIGRDQEFREQEGRE